MTIGDRFPFDVVPASAAVDLLTFTAGRPAMRLLAADVTPLAAWAVASGFGFADDGEYVVVTRGVDAQRVLAVDRSPEPHTVKLGEVLGYPSCCTAVAGERGEAALDDLAAAAERSGLLDISRYLDGVGLISHIPCGPRCGASLGQAEAALDVALRGCDDAETNERWRRIAAHFTGRAKRIQFGP